MSCEEYKKLKIKLSQKKHVWLVTGAAGFIGSNLTEALLKLNQHVIGIDNFSSGFRNNIDHVLSSVSPSQASHFRFIEMDIRSSTDCKEVAKGVDYVLHHAALVSVPQSIVNPELFHDVNLNGFLNILHASKEAEVKRLIYASSSSVYGNVNKFPIGETCLNIQLSPYGATKYMNEIYASTFSKCYSIDTVGLRYFNVYGKRQNSSGAYAAVISKWINALLNKKSVPIFGDGTASRDFCFVDDIIQANILAALTEDKKAINNVYNIASGRETTLNELYKILSENLGLSECEAEYFAFRVGDIYRSAASIDKAKNLLNYSPIFSLESGLANTINWHQKSD